MDSPIMWPKEGVMMNVPNLAASESNRLRNLQLEYNLKKTKMLGLLDDEGLKLLERVHQENIPYEIPNDEEESS